MCSDVCYGPTECLVEKVEDGKVSRPVIKIHTGSGREARKFAGGPRRTRDATRAQHGVRWLHTTGLQGHVDAG